MKEAPFVVKELNFRYRDRKELAIQNMSFQANPGEILILDEPSASLNSASSHEALHLFRKLASKRIGSQVGDEIKVVAL